MTGHHTRQIVWIGKLCKKPETCIVYAKYLAVMVLHALAYVVFDANRSAFIQLTKSCGKREKFPISQKKIYFHICDCSRFLYEGILCLDLTVFLLCLFLSFYASLLWKYFNFRFVREVFMLEKC